MKKGLKSWVSAAKKETRILRFLPQINGVISQPTYYPERERKSKREMWMDNFKWLCKYKEINKFYTSYGLDVKDYRDPDDYLSHIDFCNARNAGNFQVKKCFYGNYNYIVLLRDKYIFASHISSTIGPQYVPRTLALLERGMVFDEDAREWLPFADFCRRDLECVFKAVDGTFGDDVFLARISGGTVTAHGRQFSAGDFLSQLNKGRYILQELVVQHAALQAFGTSCVNTIRTITVRGKSGKISVFAAFLRLGTDTESFVDNRAKGGLAIGVELETGRLMKYGFPHAEFGTKYEVHPLSGIAFEGYQLPFWKEAVELVCAAHRQFYETQSIGWDVAITENGPILLEGNDGWEIGGPQDTYGGLKKRWNELVNS